MKTRVALTVLMLLLSLGANVGVAPHTRYRMTYTFENRGTTPVTLNADDLSLPVFPGTQWQQVATASVNPPSREEVTDVDGNVFMVADVSPVLPPGGSVTFEATYEIGSVKRDIPALSLAAALDASAIPKGLVEEYSAETDTFPTRDPSISGFSRRATAREPTVLGKVTRLLAWFEANVTYGGDEVPRYAEETFSDLKGDCDDQTILLVTMLRGLGVPSYMEVGVIVSPDLSSRETSWGGHLESDMKGIGWHGWAVVFVPPWGWVPIDLTYVHARDPVEKMLRAPEYGGSVITVLKVSKMDYVADSRTTRSRILDSSIYVKTGDYASAINSPPWVNPTLVGLAAALAAAIFVMFYTARRGGAP